MIINKRNYLSTVAALDCGRVLRGHHGPAVNGLALREHVRMRLVGRLRRRQPLQRAALIARHIRDANLIPKKKMCVKRDTF